MEYIKTVLEKIHNKNISTSIPENDLIPEKHINDITIEYAEITSLYNSAINIISQMQAAHEIRRDNTIDAMNRHNRIAKLINEPDLI